MPSLLQTISGGACKTYLALRLIYGEVVRKSLDAPFLASIPAIMEKASMSKNAARRGRDELMDAGIIKKVDDRGSFMFLNMRWASEAPGGGVPKRDRPLPRRGNPPSAANAAICDMGTEVAQGLRSVPKRDPLKAVARELVHRGCAILGIKEGSRYVPYAQAKATSLLRSGATPEELIEVVEWRRKQWNAGDRFQATYNLIVLWGATRFDSLLFAARNGGGKSSDTRGRRPYRVPGGSTPEWEAAYRRKIGKP